MRTAVILFFIFALGLHKGFSADFNSYNPYKGWFWYQTEKTKKHKKTVKVYTYKQLWDMYPDEFKKILNEALKQAVQNPTVQNVKQYLILQDIARRKAYAFSNVAMYVNQTTPSLDVYKDYPENSPGIRMRTGLINYDTDKVLSSYRNDYALLFFYKEGCAYCRLMSEILSAFQDQTGWTVRAFDIQKQWQVALRFNVSFVPEVILIHRGSSKWIPVANGLVALNILKRNIYHGILYFQGELNPQNWSIYRFQKGGSFDLSKFPVNPNEKIKIVIQK